MINHHFKKKGGPVEKLKLFTNLFNRQFTKLFTKNFTEQLPLSVRL